MPLHQSFVCGVSFLLNQITKRFRKTKELRSYKDWFVHIYGKQLYEIMCSQYTLKFWHVDPALLSADWADQRFQAEDMAKLVKRIIKKILRLDFSSYSIEDDSLAPDGGAFYYPLRGIQELPDALARASAKNGATILTAAEITAIDSKKKTVSFEMSGAQTVTCGNIISTIPLHSLYRLQERRDETVERALSEIKYMDIIFVYLFVNKPQISNDHWLYFPGKDIIFNRAVEFSNWSPLMCPEGKTSVCFDITTFDENKEWQMTDRELAQRTIDDAIRIKYIRKDEVISSYVFRVKSAYPFYDLDYKTKLDIVVRFLEQNSTHLLGRTGIFKYNNSDNSIEMGFELANKFLKNEQDLSIYQYRIKAISY
jgi:protoporphyrinogen oxidase